jgi:hypothetical protein
MLVNNSYNVSGSLVGAAGRVTDLRNPLWLVLGSVFVCALTNCGGGDSSNGPMPLSIQLSPSAPSLAVNSSVLISAQTTPSLPKYWGALTWSIQGYRSPTDCSELVPNPQMAPAMSGCPNGWLAWEQPFTGYTPTGVYYYAPTAVGSYKVLVQGQIMDQSMSQKVDFQGSSIVTVTVTAQ